MRRKYRYEGGAWVSDVPATEADRRRYAENIEEIVVSRTAPGVQTDATFFRGVGSLVSQCGGDEAEAQRILKGAKRQGFTPGINDMYIPTLAQSTGDPRAFVPMSEGRGGVLKRAAEIGVPVTVDGAAPKEVKVEARQAERKLGGRLAEKTIQRYLKREVARNPGIKGNKRKLREAREAIVERHSLKVD